MNIPEINIDQRKIIEEIKNNGSVTREGAAHGHKQNKKTSNRMETMESIQLMELKKDSMKDDRNERVGLE